MELKLLNFVRLVVVIILILNLMWISANAQTKIAYGDQPQLSAAKDGVIRLIYGEADKIYYSTSIDNGKTFHRPVLVGEIDGMHLGMTRGPQLATSKDYSLVTAMDKKGNIHTFRLTHRTKKWEKINNVNDSEGSAPEGLMSIAADEENHFYAVWLDLREDRQNNICFSTSKDDATWSKNSFIYKSPDGHVCECCKPSIVVKGKQVSVMFRNWIMGSRDLYLINSFDSGGSFSSAQKLGIGTWPLKACPMDGGGLSMVTESYIQTAWQRDGQVFYSIAGKPEQNIGSGRGVSMNGNLIYWQNGDDLVIKSINGQPTPVGQGTALTAVELKDSSILVVWQQDNQIVYKTIK
jgi:hypothetical protein